MSARRSLLAAALIIALSAGFTTFPVVARGDADGAGSASMASTAVRPGYTPKTGPLVLPQSSKKPRITSDLDELHRIDILARLRGAGLRASDAPSLPADLQARVDSNTLSLDDGGRVQVYVDTAADPQPVADALAALGMDVQRVSDEYRIVQGMLPIAALEAATNVDGVLLVRPPDRALLSAGSVTTQGDAILNADDLRASFGATGAGVKVGIVSDGLEGLAAAQASGDLPGSGSIDTTTCDVIESAPAGEPANPGSAGAGAEGTAMMEIVHDIAPDAQLWFGYFGINVMTGTTGTSMDFMDAVNCLAQHVDVIVDDIVFVNAGPYDGTSAISTNASTQLNSNLRPLRGYYNAAGNLALRHYQETYVDEQPPLNKFSDFHLFQAGGGTSDQMGLTAGHFNPIFLAAGGFVVIQLEWDDTWGLADDDYDLYLVNHTTDQAVAASETTQNGAVGGVGDRPTELIVYQNPGAEGYFDIAINRWKASEPTVTFDMFVTTCQCAPLPLGSTSSQPILNFNTMSSSIPNNSDAPNGVLALGAINSGEPGNDEIAPYSGRGPTNPGPAVPTRVKPELTGIDGVVISGAGGFSSPFFGTSAAAPHAAGIAALILSCNPILRHGEEYDNPANDRTVLRNALMNTAIDLGAAGVDNTYGAGRINADAAAAVAGCSPVTPTPTPSPTLTPTPTATVTITPTIPAGQDSDGDGCTDLQELGDDEVHGGKRDPFNAGDFFDVTGDRTIDVTDVVAILQRFGLGPLATGYDLKYDRYVPDSAQRWRTAFAVGPHVGIDVADAVSNLPSFGHSCATNPP